MENAWTLHYLCLSISCVTAEVQSEQNMVFLNQN